MKFEHVRLSESERAELSARTRNGDIESRNTLAMAMAPIAISISRKRATPTIPADDIFSEIMLRILVSRCTAYDPKWSVTTAAHMFAWQASSAFIAKAKRQQDMFNVGFGDSYDSVDNSQESNDEFREYCEVLMRFYRRQRKVVRRMIRLRMKGMKVGDIRKLMGLSQDAHTALRNEAIGNAVDAGIIRRSDVPQLLKSRKYHA